ncbi:hypothetical protein M8J76_001186 [Diaphorina citri]|nr:hypothetical protein M8J76_001186 [Diaphorina citri]
MPKMFIVKVRPCMKLKGYRSNSNGKAYHGKAKVCKMSLVSPPNMDRYKGGASCSLLSEVSELPSLAPSTESPHTAHLVILYFLCQMFLRELAKCSRLVTLIPMDMTGYFENRAGPSNLGNVISQILLCKQIAPDFNQEEIFSISKDSEDLTNILTEKKLSALNEDLPSKWTRKRRRSSLYKNVGSFCCLCRPNYL